MNPIDEYLAGVDAQLRLRGATRRQALAELAELLTEQAQLSSAETAVTQAGPASEYAANLDELFGADQPRKRLPGIPISLSRGLTDRIAGTFNPADPRILVPKVVGAGWSFNMGAIAVRLGLLNADDVDDEVLTSAADEHLAGPRLVAGLGVLAAAATGYWQWRCRASIEAATGKPQVVNIAAGLAMPVVAAALLVSATDDQTAPDAQIAMPAIAGSLAGIAISTNLQQTLRPGGQAIALVGLLGALAGQLALGYAPVRAAIAASVARQAGARVEPQDG